MSPSFLFLKYNTKAAVTQKRITAAVFPWHHNLYGKQAQKTKPPKSRFRFFPSGIAVPNKNTSPYELSRTEKASEQVFWLVHQSGADGLLGFPMTDFRLDFAPLHIQRLVSLRVRTAFPFHRPYLDEKDAFCGMADTLCEYLIF